MGDYDKVTQASLNGIYVKAQELDRGHNDADAPAARPAGFAAFDAPTDSSHAFDTQSHASDSESHASTHVSDSETHASDV